MTASDTCMRFELCVAKPSRFGRMQPAGNVLHQTNLHHHARSVKQLQLRTCLFALEKVPLLHSPAVVSHRRQ